MTHMGLKMKKTDQNGLFCLFEPYFAPQKAVLVQ